MCHISMKKALYCYLSRKMSPWVSRKHTEGVLLFTHINISYMYIMFVNLTTATAFTFWNEERMFLVLGWGWGWGGGVWGEGG